MQCVEPDCPGTSPVTVRMAGPRGDWYWCGACFSGFVRAYKQRPFIRGKRKDKGAGKGK